MTIINYVSRTGEVIHWNQNQALGGDETIGPLFEDIILLNVINLIDPRLPQFIKEYYQLKLGERHLMDVWTDIFNNIKKFLSELDTAEQLNSLRTQSLLPTAAATTNSLTLTAFSTARSVRSRGRGRGIPQPSHRQFCKTCYNNEKGKITYLSHITNNATCPTKFQLNAIVDDLLPPEVQDEFNLHEEQEAENEVEYNLPKIKLTNNFLGLNTVQPVPTHLLTLTDHIGIPIHIELDNGATVNYITVNKAKARNFKISPNNQTSKLGDGHTILLACGEINVILYRDNVPLQFHALVCNKLHSPVIRGTLFIKQNGIKQDFNNNTICLLNDRSIVPDRDVYYSKLSKLFVPLNI